MQNIKSAFLALLFGLFFLSNLSFASNGFVRNLLGTQLEIGLSLRGSSLASLKGGNIGNALSLQQNLSYRNQYDLISQLDRAKSEQERLEILDQYIISLSDIVSNGSAMYDYEQSKVDQYNQAAKDCESPIKSKNSEFSDAVKTYNYEKAESIANEIAELRACVARNQVYAKAHASYASATNSLSSLQKKANYLSENKAKIAKYYEILKPDLLKELYDISKTVEANF